MSLKKLTLIEVVNMRRLNVPPTPSNPNLTINTLYKKPYMDCEHTNMCNRHTHATCIEAITMARKLKFNSAEQFDRKVDQYVKHCNQQDEPLTVPGLALFLGFADKSSLYQYQKRDGFEDSVKRARTLIEQYLVKRSMLGNPAGAIFILKNMGYSDKQELRTEPIQIVISGKDALL